MGLDHDIDARELGVDFGGTSACIAMATSGVCGTSSGRGGWCAVIMEDGCSRNLMGHENDANGDRMQLLAVVEGLAAIDVGSRVTLHHDSRYVHDGITFHMRGWIERGWRNADGKQTKNHDLWERLLKETKRHQIIWAWCDFRPAQLNNETNSAPAVHAKQRTIVTMKTERSCQ